MVKYKWFILGIITLLLVKYYVFGLNKWNSIFHPGRIEAGNDEKYKKSIFA